MQSFEADVDCLPFVDAVGDLPEIGLPGSRVQHTEHDLPGWVRYRAVGSVDGSAHGDVEPSEENVDVSDNEFHDDDDDAGGSDSPSTLPPPLGLPPAAEHNPHAEKCWTPPEVPQPAHPRRAGSLGMRNHVHFANSTRNQHASAFSGWRPTPTLRRCGVL